MEGKMGMWMRLGLEVASMALGGAAYGRVLGWWGASGGRLPWPVGLPTAIGAFALFALGLNGLTGGQ